MSIDWPKELTGPIKADLVGATAEIGSQVWSPVSIVSDALRNGETVHVVHEEGLRKVAEDAIAVLADGSLERYRLVTYSGDWTEASSVAVVLPEASICVYVGRGDAKPFWRHYDRRALGQRVVYLDISHRPTPPHLPD